MDACFDLAGREPAVAHDEGWGTGPGRAGPVVVERVQEDAVPAGAGGDADRIHAVGEPDHHVQARGHAGASGTGGASDLQIEIVRMLLAAGATLADVDRYGVAVADRIQSQALAAGQL